MATPQMGPNTITGAMSSRTPTDHSGQARGGLPRSSAFLNLRWGEGEGVCGVGEWRRRQCRRAVPQRGRVGGRHVTAGAAAAECSKGWHGCAPPCCCAQASPDAPVWQQHIAPQLCAHQQPMRMHSTAMLIPNPACRKTSVVICTGQLGCGVSFNGVPLGMQPVAAPVWPLRPTRLLQPGGLQRVGRQRTATPALFRCSVPQNPPPGRC